MAMFRQGGGGGWQDEGDFEIDMEQMASMIDMSQLAGMGGQGGESFLERLVDNDFYNEFDDDFDDEDLA
jgi:hypothetical protein